LRPENQHQIPAYPSRKTVREWGPPHSDEFYGQPFNSILERQDAFVKADVRLTWEYNDRISTQVFVNNITDEATATRFVWGGGGALQASYAPPRLAGLTVSVRY
jgi:iron complex outermembrane recepter protein